MAKFLVISFQSGTYGNYVSQQFVKLFPDHFCLLAQYPKVYMTKAGNRYYHNSSPYLGDVFYYGPSTYPNLGNDPLSTDAVTEIQAAVKQSDSHSSLSESKYNIVLTHMHTDGALDNLKTVLGHETKVLKIVYNKESMFEIASRFVDINTELDHDLQNKITVDMCLPILETARVDTKFTTVQYERIFEDGYLQQIGNSIL